MPEEVRPEESATKRWRAMVEAGEITLRLVWGGRTEDVDQVAARALETFSVLTRYLGVSAASWWSGEISRRFALNAPSVRELVERGGEKLADGSQASWVGYSVSAAAGDLDSVPTGPVATVSATIKAGRAEGYADLVANSVHVTIGGGLKFPEARSRDITEALVAVWDPDAAAIYTKPLFRVQPSVMDPDWDGFARPTVGAVTWLSGRTPPVDIPSVTRAPFNSGNLYDLRGEDGAFPTPERVLVARQRFADAGLLAPIDPVQRAVKPKSSSAQ